LINGETGTGKDVAARLLHQSSALKEQPFVHVDCASLPTDLIETELFGHEKGAFTSAQGARAGLIEAAEDGTLFLDEIGELPLTLQAKLLNVLERRVVRRVGSTRERPVNARIMAATNRDLQMMVAQGSFRSDLYYRLNVLALHMPPLRERGDDIMLLAQHFTEQTERRYGLARHRFAEDAQNALLRYGWPGNVRELRHHISRTILLIKDQTIYAHDLQLPGQMPFQAQPLPQPPQAHLQSLSINQGVRHPEPFGQYPSSAAVPAASAMTLDHAEKMLIQNALQETHYNVSEAARKLGITRMAMRYRMEKHGIRW
jgi:transcriptional regulator with GAF, ATPase, and Fis domain